MQINNIEYKTFFCNDMKEIIIYCHGYGANKDHCIKYIELLNKNKIGVISFDFPCHGDDQTLYQDVTIDMCLEYIDTIYNFILHNNPNIPISIVGKSFGGYIVLNYINTKKRKFHKVILLCPAVNFYECTKRKIHIDDNYFNNNKYFELPSGYRIYKEFYFDAKKFDVVKEFNKNGNDIYIIHGSNDKTVFLDDVLDFTKQYDIKIKIIDGTDHHMNGYDELITKEIITYINEI